MSEMNTETKGWTVDKGQRFSWINWKHKIVHGMLHCQRRSWYVVKHDNWNGANKRMDVNIVWCVRDMRSNVRTVCMLYTVHDTCKLQSWVVDLIFWNNVSLTDFRWFLLVRLLLKFDLQQKLTSSFFFLFWWSYKSVHLTGDQLHVELVWWEISNVRTFCTKFLAEFENLSY